MAIAAGTVVINRIEEHQSVRDGADLLVLLGRIEFRDGGRCRGYMAARGTATRCDHVRLHAQLGGVLSDVSDRRASVFDADPGLDTVGFLSAVLGADRHHYFYIWG